MHAPIPAFYCCYLLRSISSPKKFYVGSTPNAKRRLKQHNGGVLGGAKRTHQDRDRPWAMTCLVSGFPSRMAALQFEWAWQNPHNTRHISKADRITEPIVRLVTDRKSKKKRFKIYRPTPSSLRHELGNLHLLLRAQSFARWPLEVKFFTRAEYEFWKTWDAQAGLKQARRIHVSMIEGSISDESLLNKTANAVAAATNVAAVNSLDFSYASLKETLRCSTSLLSTLRHECSLCQQEVSPPNDLALTCTQTTCEMVTHLTCLSRHFLQHDPDPSALLPTNAPCSSCKTELSWSTLMTDLSLRLRGPDVIQKLLKVKGAISSTQTSNNLMSTNASGLQHDVQQDIYAGIELDAPEDTEINTLEAGPYEHESLQNYQHDEWYHDSPVPSITMIDSDDALSISSAEWKDIETIT